MNEKITCMICGKEFATRITPSHLKTHNTTMFEYRSKYPNSQLVTTSCAKKSCVTLQNQINKYGLEEGTKRFNEYVEKQRYAGCSLDYFQAKYGNEEGLLKYKTTNQLKGFTLQNQINKYGLEEGTKRFNEIISSYNKIKYANSMLATNIINLILLQLPIEIATNAKCLQTEFFIHRNNKIYFYDLTFPKYKKIIEINGYYWHANPIKYHHNDIIKFPNSIKIASDIWERDFNKMKHVIDYGFDVKYIWEHDFNKNAVQTISEAVKWILN